MKYSLLNFRIHNFNAITINAYTWYITNIEVIKMDAEYSKRTLFEMTSFEGTE